MQHLAFLALAMFALLQIGCAKRSNKSDAKFDINMRNTGNTRMCEIVFTGELPTPATVDKIVRESLENAVSKDASKDILAAAFQGDEELTSNQYSGMLVYKAVDKKIQTIDEANGVKYSTSATPSYFVETEEQHTYPGITPPKTWLSLTIVFAKKPSTEVAYDAIISEITKVTKPALDVDAYVSVGDKNVKTSWHQMRDDDGAFIFAEYKPATKEVTRKGRILKVLR
jgi:hypothetical protein